MGMRSPSLIALVLLAVAALLLCLFSVMTSRSRRPRHRTYFGWAVALVVLSVLVWFLDLAVKLLGDIQGEPDDWLLLLMCLNLLTCTLPIWRFMQSRRMREAQSRYRRSGSIRR